MSEPFMAEIRAFSFGFVPKGWFACAGQLLPLQQYQALFSILGTTYGGNGTTNFALPDLRGRAPVHQGSAQDTTNLGERGGAETVTLSTAEAKCTVMSDHAPTTSRPDGRWPAQGGAYGQPTGTISQVGGGQPHENRSPYLALTYAIAHIGVFPSRD